MKRLFQKPQGKEVNFTKFSKNKVDNLIVIRGGENPPPEEDPGDDTPFDIPDPKKP